jgi:hypothetical protein
MIVFDATVNLFKYKYCQGRVELRDADPETKSIKVEVTRRAGSRELLNQIVVTQQTKNEAPSAFVLQVMVNMFCVSSADKPL